MSASVKLIEAGRLKKGDVIDHWIFNQTVVGKAVEKVSRNGVSVTVDFIDNTRDVIPHYVAVFVREPKCEAQKNVILEMTDDKRARKWRSVAGSSDIQNPHIPLGWIPVDWVDVLRELLAEGRIEIRESRDSALLINVSGAS